MTYRLRTRQGFTADAEYAATLSERLIAANARFCALCTGDGPDAEFDAAEQAYVAMRDAMRADLRMRLGLSDGQLDKLMDAL